MNWILVRPNNIWQNWHLKVQAWRAFCLFWERSQSPGWPWTPFPPSQALRLQECTANLLGIKFLQCGQAIALYLLFQKKKKVKKKKEKLQKQALLSLVNMKLNTLGSVFIYSPWFYKMFAYAYVPVHLHIRKPAVLVGVLLNCSAPRFFETGSLTQPEALKFNEQGQPVILWDLLVSASLVLRAQALDTQGLKIWTQALCCKKNFTDSAISLAP